MSLIPAADLSKFHPEHSASDQKRVEKWWFKETSNNWKINKQEIILLPEQQIEPIIKYINKTTHYGRDSTYIKPWVMGPGTRPGSL